MDILDIAIAKQLAGGGGGSGTDSYNDLSNLPKINDVTLSGNKSSSALGLQSEITSENKLDSDLIDDTDQDNKFVTSSEKNIWNAKQNAIDADHKLNADYVDDSTSTNKFVTASDKEAWNAKQNAIDNSHKLSSDLVDDANHTNKFVTSTEKNTWNGKQNAIDSEHKLSSSLVSFTTAEAAALASGIDSSKVAQISTNQSNILYNMNMGVKNVASINDVTYTAPSGGGALTVPCSEITGNIVIYFGTISSTDTDASTCLITRYYTDGTSETGGTNRGSNIADNVSTGSKVLKELRIYPSDNWSHSSGDTLTIANLMVCTEDAWNQSHDFQPFALPNYDLTRLESEDRASLAEVVDSGAKNLFDVPSSATIDTITWTADSNSYITASPNNTDTRGWGYNPSQYKLNLKAGTYVCVLDIKTASSQSGLGLAMYSSSGTNIFSSAISQIQNKTGIVTWKFTISTAGSYGIEFKCYDMVARIMICTKAAFGVSNKFVPYRPNYDLVCDSVIDLNDMISSFTVNSSKSVSIKLRRDSSFTMLMFGFVQTIGKVHWYIESNTSTSVSIIDAMTGLAVSQSVISFAYSESTAILTISANVSGNCNFVLIRSAY